MISIPSIKVQEKKIFYRIKEANNKKAIIFIHGSGENSNVWKQQLQIDINYNLIALDLPSHAESDKFEKLSLDLYSRTIETLISELKMNEVILCGHSLGGAVAQMVYLRDQVKIKGLILLGTGARLRVSPMILKSLEKNFEAYLQSIPIGAFYRKTDEKIIKECIKEVKKTPPSVCLADFKICDRFDILDEVKKGTITIPSLIICGTADKLTPIKYSQFFADHINNAVLTLIKHAGHMVMIEKPEATNQAIKTFIRSI